MTHPAGLARANIAPVSCGEEDLGNPDHLQPRSARLPAPERSGHHQLSNTSGAAAISSSTVERTFVETIEACRAVLLAAMRLQQVSAHHRGGGQRDHHGTELRW